MWSVDPRVCDSMVLDATATIAGSTQNATVSLLVIDPSSCGGLYGRGASGDWDYAVGSGDVTHPDRPDMATEEECCAEARKFRRIDDAFHQGDLEALRAAVDDPGLVPNGRMPHAIGSCLVYAIYHSPLAFIQTLLEVGADPNAPVDVGSRPSSPR